MTIRQWMFLYGAIAGIEVVIAQSQIPTMPMAENYADSIRARWEAKPILETRWIDGMEDLVNWRHDGAGDMALTDQRAREGRHSLRITCPTKGTKPGGEGGRPWGACIVTRKIDGEDWQAFNRLSFWVYPDMPGFKIVSMCVVLRNEGIEKVPNMWDRNGRNFVLVKNQQWNHIVMEIAHLGRDKVVGVEFSYRQQGNEPGATETVQFDFDQLELQKVEADHFEGWNVAPGQIAYSHTGYPTGFSKRAFGGNLGEKEFSLLTAKDGKELLRKPIEIVKTEIGRFEVMDFSSVDQPGRYILQAGTVKTKPFAIGPYVWRDTILKTINHFYCQRCGTAIPGIHDLCHADWTCESGGRKLPINGGWHDAGDLSQGLVNTSEAVVAMLLLADKIKTSDIELFQPLIEEARWGLDWVLKCRFGDGSRCTWATMDFWTDGKLGTVDDVTSRANNSPFDNFMGASAEAVAARVFKDFDPIKAAECLTAAKEDWRWAMDNAGTPGLELAGAALNTSLDLFEATREPGYHDAAVRFAATVTDCQQIGKTDWTIPLEGFFYTDAGKRRIQHYSHRGHEQAPIVGLVRLCESLPTHGDFAKWDTAVRRYADYYKTIVRFTEPYGMLPAGVYDLQESNRPEQIDQIKQGVTLSDRYYLRRFPVWFDFRGNCGTVLSQTKGLAAAGRYLKDQRLLDLCQRQLQWNLGLNPFSQSLMYGQGYDFAPQYSAMSGDIVGSLPVGIETHFERDLPYYPPDNCYNYKEVWVHPSSRWLYIMTDLYPVVDLEK